MAGNVVSNVKKYYGGQVPVPGQGDSDGKVKVLIEKTATMEIKGAQTEVELLYDADDLTTPVTPQQLGQWTDENYLIAFKTKDAEGTVRGFILYALETDSTSTDTLVNRATFVNFKGDMTDPGASAYEFTMVEDSSTLTRYLRDENGELIVKFNQATVEAGAQSGTLDNLIATDSTYMDFEVVHEGDNAYLNLNTESLDKELDDIWEYITDIIDAIDELPSDEHGYFNSTLIQTPGDGTTENIVIDDFRISQGRDVHGDNIEFVPTHQEGGIDYGEVYLNPGTYIFTVHYTLQWVGNPRGTFLPLVTNVGDRPFDFSYEHEDVVRTTRIVTRTTRGKFSLGFPIDADTPQMGIWVKNLEIAQIASYNHPAVAHDTTLTGTGKLDSPLGVTPAAFGKIKDIPTSISQFRTGDVIPVDGPNGPAKMAASDLQDAILGGPIDEAVQAWLDEHPEATTTVEDNSITDSKLHTSIKFTRASGEHNLGYKVLVQDSPLAQQMSEANTIYEVRWAFDLNGGTLVIPSNCTLKFNGGMIYNGVVNLNGSTDIEGRGLNCEILNPKVSSKFESLSKFLGDTSDASLNRKVLQTLIDAGARIFVDTGIIDIDAEVYVRTSLHIIGVDQNLSGFRFPASRGFVFNGDNYSSYNLVQNLNIFSNNDSFVLCGDLIAERPKNVYFSLFKSLIVTSYDGHCFYAGDNKGSGGDTCVFDCKFSDIRVSARVGCCFYGISGNTITFDKVSIVQARTAAFYNCSGLFDSINGVFDSESPTFFKASGTSTLQQRINCIFNNCNIESYKGVLFDCSSSYVLCHIIFNSCTFYVNATGGVVSFFPFDFYYLYNVELNSCLWFGTFNFASGYCMFRIQAFDKTTTFVNNTQATLGINHNNSYYSTVPPTLKSSVTSAFSSQSFFSRYTQYASAFTTDIHFVKAIVDYYTDVSLTTDLLALGDYNNYNIKTSNDTEGTTYGINGVSGYLLNNVTNFHRKLLIRNNNSHAKLRLNPGQAGTNSFITHSGGSVILSPGEVVVGYLCVGIGVFIDHKYIASSSVWKTSGSSAGRPSLSSADEGHEYYDSTLKKKILWNGTDWVNMDGTPLA